LNDGGVTANECSEHCGLHIDTERSIMEVVDKDGNQIENGEGRILATSLYNYAMPFIRYDTGDLGYIIDDVCGCGRGYKLLKELVGRSVDVLVTPEGKNVHGWFFLYIFWEYCKGIKEYQVVQEKIDKIVIKIIPEEDFDEKQLDKIREIIKKRSGGWLVEFKFVDKIEKTGAGKYKFIISKVVNI
jgi:phenylacetate-CoA ligase